MTTTPGEAQRRYDSLTKRIAAVDADISRELDGERRLALEQRRADLERERDGVQSEIAANDHRANGDLELLQRRVQDLARVLVSDHPQEAHAIIDECVTALARVDSRVSGLEGRVSAIERHIHPPFMVTAWRVMAITVLVFGAAFILWQRVLLLDLYPLFGVVLGVVFVALAAACLLLANAKTETRR